MAATWQEEKVKKVLQQETKEKLITVMEDDFDALKKEAENFITVVRKVSEKRKIMASKEKLSKVIDIVTNKMNEDKMYTQEIINAQHVFDMNINAFINRTMYLTYVHSDGGLSFYNELNVGKLYDAFITKGKGNCLGLSQFGSNELALNGCSYIQILKYYFPTCEVRKYK